MQAEEVKREDTDQINLKNRRIKTVVTEALRSFTDVNAPVDQ